MPNLQEIGDALDSRVRNSKDDYVSLVSGEKHCGVKRVGIEALQIAYGIGNSFRSCVLKKIDGEWVVLNNPLHNLAGAE